ncbi:polysaccharide pyruvyl transferase family protein [Vibrio crassostreae]|uniref:polysaccharide pyruvyl transferase family protein n=1 Tax=Vibrio crassostreae TaxID=246167 RepID=UPI001053B5C1|nr:polysaccharide pyruvyl transferase family protein [Vibrio crassostreae]TCN93849.1 polysaccharide pyruvyl transferase [Vibrio crassostreae]CAK2010639.1 Polysaccharide pyruvyl transferase [Vibrio crassostreae]CAK2016214.1 Polysaccharide pyruvyl transferase [Vibrio crassostreae]CAK2019290.1 Polysaccharide pyruvyl transferase [Vibrio crassostreae]CAK2801948.1 Polysaccharide pyruvyl transferase [Vibrio crassostreae]
MKKTNSKKNVAVVTFPLINNYGGIIQAYALMLVLSELGHKPTLINLKSERRYLSVSKYIFKKYVLFFLKKYRSATLTIKARNLENFIDKYISPKSDSIWSSKQLHKHFISNKYDACIVGSDQVFAKMGYPKFENDYSLGFVDDETIKLSYAASFGGNDYLGDINTVENHKINLQRFAGVSVREKSAVQVCFNRFSVNAKHVLDPTMLIDKKNYIDIIEGYSGQLGKDKLFAYVLDSDLIKNNIMTQFADKKEITINQINDGNNSKNIISMQEWLGSIYSAEHVITDSFHGCVFCIIFNKPFHCFVNIKRGADRFYSLLEMFGLENRIINGDIIDGDINWNDVNSKLEKYKLESLNFLNVNL